MKKIIKTILKRMAFAMLSFFVVLMMCAAVVAIFNGSKP
jgi:hypothetical protein